MSKLDLVPRVPAQYERQTMADIVRAICGQLNPLSEGRISARYNAQSVAPSGGSISYNVGDFLPDLNCTVSSSVVPGLGMNYLRLGWVCRVAGTPGTFEEVRILTGGGSGFPTFSPVTASLAADVSMNNVANYFDGPSVAQGSSGTWFVAGTVTVVDTATAAVMRAKLWDGNTVIASGNCTIETAGRRQSISLSGFMTSPTGNLRISCKDESATTGKILANDSGNSKDSSITAFRLA